MSTDSDPLLSLAQDVAWVTSGDIVFLTLPARREPFTVLRLSPTGSTVWNLIDGHRRLSDVVRDTAGLWGATEDSVADAVRALCDALIHHGAVRRHPA